MNIDHRMLALDPTAILSMLISRPAPLSRICAFNLTGYGPTPMSAVLIEPTFTPVSYTVTPSGPKTSLIWYADPPGTNAEVPIVWKRW
ncbi:unnamed protein product, partial [Mycena citricolor]